MKKRFNYYILLLFMSLSLISIGFASWSITGPNSSQDTSSTGLVTSEGVVNASSIIETKIESFKYFNTCFVDKDENNKYTIPSNKGYITITVKVLANNTSITNPVLNLSIYQNSKLKSNSSNVNTEPKGILSDVYIKSITLNGNGNGLSILYGGTMLTLSYSFGNTITTQTLVFKIEYDFSIDSDKNSVKNDFFNTLMNYDVTFSTLSIIGGN